MYKNLFTYDFDVYVSFFFHILYFILSYFLSIKIMMFDILRVLIYNNNKKTIHHGVYLTFMLKIFTRYILRYQVEFTLSLTLP